MKLNFFKIKAGVFRHKQIEKKGDLLFMRIKKRPAVMVVRKPIGG